MQEPNKIFEQIMQLGSLPMKAINGLINFAMSSKRRRFLADIRKIADRVNAKRPEMLEMTDQELNQQTDLLKNRLMSGESLDDILVDAFAVAREAARRVLNEEPYLVQIMGGVVLHRGMIAEMKTGEGKTLVAILPSYLNALAGKGVHVVTVNDYLAKRDAEMAGRVFEFLGLRASYIVSSMDESMKKYAYNADVTYCTNNELGFDFLRDNLVHNKDDASQRKLNFCIVDEADSVLIDEARTPLIISGPSDDASSGYILCDQLIKKLDTTHYTVNLKEHQAHFTDTGIEEIDRLLRESGHLTEDEYLYSAKNSVLLHQLMQSLKANHLYRLGIDYIVDTDPDGFGGRSRPSIKIIDEHTGRTLQGRRYSEGLHQALEAKENVPIRPESETLASITFQRLFRLYTKLSGMTGTAITEAEEFEKTYNLRCLDIPTNLPIKRIDYDDVIYITKREKIKAIVELVTECHSRGQPVIVGTTSVESSEEMGMVLTRAGFNINILNAKHHEREAEIIANAGRFGSVTVVTNMAGRGTDIKLGGDWRILAKKRTIGMDDEDQIQRIIEEIKSEVSENKAKVIEAGGLYVIGVEHNNNRRIDNQLRGRSGRQGDPGASKFFMCTEDDLIMKFNPNMSAMLLQFGANEDEVMEHPWLTSAIDTAQKRMEAYNFEVRQSMQKYADIKESYIMKFYNKRRKLLDDNVMNDLVNLFETTINNPKLLPKLIELMPDKVRDTDLRIDFYGRTKAYQDRYGYDTENMIRRVMLESLDLNCRRYMGAMAHAKDIVAFQSYTQKDPIISYYEIASKKYEEMLENMNFDSLARFISSSDESINDDSGFLESFNNLKDYLANLNLTINEEGQVDGVALKDNFDEKSINSSENNVAGVVDRNDPNQDNTNDTDKTNSIEQMIPDEK